MDKTSQVKDTECGELGELDLRELTLEELELVAGAESSSSGS